VKKSSIENAAIRLFASRGLASTTIRDIALEAGVTEGALYRHYSGKNDMAWKLFCREVEHFSADLQKILFEPAATPGDKLEAGIRYLYSYYEAHPLQFSFILLTQHGFPGVKLLDKARNPNDLVIRFIGAVIMESGSEVDDPVLAAGMIMGLALQPIVMHRYGRVKKLTGKLVDKVVEASKRILVIND
jgi:AcrR family transcriptional regulator